MFNTFSYFSYKGRGSAHPTLQPLSAHICLNSTVTFSCQDNNVTEMSWIAPNYIMTFSKLSYSSPYPTFNEQSSNSHFLANLTSIHLNSEENDILDNIETNLYVMTAGLPNKTEVVCETFYFTEGHRSSFIIYFSGM